ncbi:distal tail protein Dit [Caproiciproducens galactitolivorans]|uniref:Phage tail family protein n=1 Tax=Caproiciproducens galactitolivorans TaxID=642589 RepID=A0ABT4BTD2_9FIRM|nr:distal tail protein Dit [Caproiciproducens galactitolivorans]MCY1714045.1 phage tail family protein [Caproiciproducens galactitolivorans]
MLSFEFGGKDSFRDFGVYVEKRPNIPSPERRVTYIDVPGMDSSLRRDEGTYGDITLSVECSLLGDPVSKISAIKGWLLGAGEADLIFSHIPGRKYLAQVVNSIDFEIVLKVTSHFIIVFSCRPFQYATDNTPVTVSESATLTNPGTVKSFPMIKVTGSGAGALTVNENSVSFSNIDESIILNSEIQETYQNAGVELISKNSIMTGEYPALLPGENTISFSGGITSLEITPNWRWL